MIATGRELPIVSMSAPQMASMGQAAWKDARTGTR